MPKLGYVLRYAGTVYGYVLLIVVPSILLVLGELRRLLGQRG